jgi:transcriptional regulator with XRE-family HTH domain
VTAPGAPRRNRGPALGFREGRQAAARMRELRVPLTQAQFAGKLGWSTSKLAKREQGAVRLTVPEAEKVAAALGTSLAGLTGGTP